MHRKENWPILLSDFLKSKQSAPFKWGENDCILFCADAVFALTGTDHAFDYRGTYDTEAGAQYFIEASGGIENIITAVMGRGSKEINKAKRGDIVIVLINDKKMAGIIDDTGAKVAAVNYDGLVRVPLKYCLKYWSY